MSKCNSDCIHYSRPKGYEHLIQCDISWPCKPMNASPLFFNPPHESAMNTQGWFYYISKGGWKGDLNNLFHCKIVLNFKGSGLKGIWHPSVDVARDKDGWPVCWSKDHINQQKERLHDILQNT